MTPKPGALFDPASPLNRLRACTRPEDKLRGYFHWLAHEKKRTPPPAGSAPPATRLPSFRVFRAGKPEQALSADLRVVLHSEGAARHLGIHVQLRDSHDFPARQAACRVYLLEQAVLGRLTALAQASPIEGKGDQVLSAEYPAGLRALALLADGRIAFAGDDGTVQVGDSAGGSTPALERQESPVCALAVLPDGRLACGGADGVIRLWDPATGKDKAVARQPGLVTALAALPGGRLASGGKDGQIRLWHLATGAVRTQDLRREVETLAALPDGRLASGDSAGMTQLWDLLTGAVETVGRPSWGRARGVLPDGRVLFQDQRERACLWEPVSRAEQVVELSEPGRVLAVLSDGRLALAGPGGRVQLTALPASPETRAAHAVLPAVFRDGFLADNFEVARVLSALPELEGTLDGQGRGRLTAAALPGGEFAVTADDLCGRLFFAVVIDQ